MGKGGKTNESTRGEQEKWKEKKNSGKGEKGVETQVFLLSKVFKSFPAASAVTEVQLRTSSNVITSKNAVKTEPEEQCKYFYAFCRTSP